MRTVESVLSDQKYRRLWRYSHKGFNRWVTINVVILLGFFIIHLLVLPTAAESAMGSWMPPELVQKIMLAWRGSILLYVAVSTSMFYDSFVTQRAVSRLLQELKDL